MCTPNKDNEWYMYIYIPNKDTMMSQSLPQPGGMTHLVSLYKLGMITGTDLHLHVCTSGTMMCKL